MISSNSDGDKKENVLESKKQEINLNPDCTPVMLSPVYCTDDEAKKINFSSPYSPPQKEKYEYAESSFGHQLSDEVVGCVMTPYTNSRSLYRAREYISTYNIKNGKRGVVLLPWISDSERMAAQEAGKLIGPRDGTAPFAFPVTFIPLPKNRFVVLLFDKAQKYQLADDGAEAVAEGSVIQLKRPISFRDRIYFWCTQEKEEFVIISRRKWHKNHLMTAKVILINLATGEQAKILKTKKCSLARIETCMVSANQMMVVQTEGAIFKTHIYDVNFKSMKVKENVEATALFKEKNKPFEIEVSDNGKRLFYCTDKAEYVYELVHESLNNKVTEFKQLHFTFKEIYPQGIRYVSPSGNFLLRLDGNASSKENNILYLLNLSERITRQVEISPGRLIHMFFTVEDIFAALSGNNLMLYPAYESRHVKEQLMSGDCQFPRNVASIIIDYGFFHKPQRLADKKTQGFVDDDTERNKDDFKNNGGSLKSG